MAIQGEQALLAALAPCGTSDFVLGIPAAVAEGTVARPADEISGVMVVPRSGAPRRVRHKRL